MDTYERLQEAARTGESVTIIYMGGSQPGAKRVVMPIRVTPVEMRARDLTTTEVKQFLLTRTEVVADDHPAPVYVPGAVTPPKYKRLLDATAPELDRLRALGWHVEASPRAVTLHLYFKNGKPRKGATAMITEDRGERRPWSVFGPDLSTTRRYGHLDRAVAAFLEQALIHAPQRLAVTPSAPPPGE